MPPNNRTFDLADQRAEQEREAGVCAVQATVSRLGTLVCEDCSGTIGRQRRAAAPFARRCLDCQAAFERSRRLYRHI